MKNKIFIVFFVMVCLALTSAIDQKVIILTLRYDLGNVTVQNLFVSNGTFYPSINAPSEGYNLSIIDKNEKVIYSQLFEFSLEIHGAPDPSWFDKNGTQIVFPREEDSVIKLNSTILELALPYYENASRIEIRDKSRKLIENISLSSIMLNLASTGNLTGENAGNVTGNEGAGGKSDRTKIYKWVGTLLIITVVIITGIIILYRRKNSEGLAPSIVEEFNTGIPPGPEQPTEDISQSQEPEQVSTTAAQLPIQDKKQGITLYESDTDAPN
jgi:hypothetical protein